MVPEKIKKLSYKQKIFTGICTSLGALVAIVSLLMMVDNRYAKAASQNEVNQKTIQILQEFKADMIADRDNLQKIFMIQQKSIKINSLTERKYRLKDLMRKYPDDQDLKEDYNDVKEQLNQMKGN